MSQWIEKICLYLHKSNRFSILIINLLLLSFWGMRLILNHSNQGTLIKRLNLQSLMKLFHNKKIIVIIITNLIYPNPHKTFITEVGKSSLIHHFPSKNNMFVVSVKTVTLVCYSMNNMSLRQIWEKNLFLPQFKNILFRPIKSRKWYESMKNIWDIKIYICCR